MTKTLYDRINDILGRNVPALGGVSAEAISVIRELERRLEDANQLFQDICGEVPFESEAYNTAFKGTYVTDIVADFRTKGSVNE